MTYLNLFVERPACDEAIAVGDIVAVGADQFLHYEVMAIRGPNVWLREPATGRDCIVVAVKCRLIRRPFRRDAP